MKQEIHRIYMHVYIYTYIFCYIYITYSVRFGTSTPMHPINTVLDRCSFFFFFKSQAHIDKVVSFTEHYREHILLSTAMFPRVQVISIGIISLFTSIIMKYYKTFQYYTCTIVCVSRKQKMSSLSLLYEVSFLFPFFLS